MSKVRTGQVYQNRLQRIKVGKKVKGGFQVTKWGPNMPKSVEVIPVDNFKNFELMTESKSIRTLIESYHSAHEVVEVLSEKTVRELEDFVSDDEEFAVFASKILKVKPSEIAFIPQSPTVLDGDYKVKKNHPDKFSERRFLGVQEGEIDGVTVLFTKDPFGIFVAKKNVKKIY